MKKSGFFTILFALAIIITGCSPLKKTKKASAVTAESGLSSGTVVETLIGKDGKSAVVGATIDVPVGAMAPAIIGKQMDKIAVKSAAIEGAKVESFTDVNDLKALLVTFDSGVLFEFNKSNLTDVAKKSLAKFADILLENSAMNMMIFGHTDNVGTLDANQKASQEQANIVAQYLKLQGIPVEQITQVAGRNFSNPVASNDTAAGRTQNRRVEIYLYASQQMIKEAR